MQYGFYFDQSRCTGCNSCTVACKDWNQINPGPVRWRKQENHEDGNSVFENLSMACNHCERPACVAACSVGAITKTNKGLVLINRKKCQSLRACITACPFASIHTADDRQESKKLESWQVNHPAQKCGYCWERVEDNMQPVCVAACPVHALDFGDVDALMRRYPDTVRLNKNDFPYAYTNNSTDTGPSFLIKKRKNLIISKI